MLRRPYPVNRPNRGDKRDRGHRLIIIERLLLWLSGGHEATQTIQARDYWG